MHRSHDHNKKQPHIDKAEIYAVSHKIMKELRKDEQNGQLHVLDKAGAAL